MRPGVAVAVLSAAVSLTMACTQAGQGMPVAEPSDSGTATSTTTSSGPSGSSAMPSTGAIDIDHPDFGVVPTNNPVPTGGVTCAPDQRPPVGVAAEVADPAAPVITIAVPQGWSIQGGSGDIAAQLSGPDAMTATVSITATVLEPQQAFGEYADALTEDAVISSVSVLPAQLCDYSGQKLLGSTTTADDTTVTFIDRVVHIPTAGGNYLVAIHAEAPSHSDEFDSAAAQLVEDFEVKIP